MTSILFLTEEIIAIFSDAIISETKKIFSFFFFFFWHFLNVDSILNIFKKKDDRLSYFIFELTDSEKRG